MSSEIPSPPEAASNPSGTEAVRISLETMSIGPELMHAFAREALQGTELVGTNLTIDVRKKLTNPDIFSYDYSAEALSHPVLEGLNHKGFAKIFVATEGVRPMITGQEEGSKAGAVNVLVKQLLKNHRKGMASINLKPGDKPVTSKAGKLSPSENSSLANAERATISYLLDCVAGPMDRISQEAALDVAKWVGGRADEDDGIAIIADIADRMAPLLTQVVELAEQEK